MIFTVLGGITIDATIHHEVDGTVLRLGTSPAQLELDTEVLQEDEPRTVTVYLGDDGAPVLDQPTIPVYLALVHVPQRQYGYVLQEDGDVGPDGLPSTMERVPESFDPQAVHVELFPLLG